MDDELKRWMDLGYGDCSRCAGSGIKMGCLFDIDCQECNGTGWKKNKKENVSNNNFGSLKN